MRLKKCLALLLAAAMLSAGFAGCGSGTGTSSSAPGTGSSAPADGTSSAAPAAPAEGALPAVDAVNLSVVVSPKPDTMDPTLNSAADVATMLIHLFEGLYSLDQQGVPQPAQAEKVELSEDGLTYTFTLRDGLKWSDGSPITSKDYVYSWQRAVDPETASDYANMFECVAGYEAATDNANEGANADPTKLQVSAPDDKTFVVTLNAPTAYFLELTAFPTYFPVQQATVDANGEQWPLAAETYISNGPYKMTEFVAGSHILVVKNPEYWNIAAIGPESIKFNLIEDDAAQLSAFESGAVGFIDGMPNDEIDAWKSRPEYKSIDQIGTYYVSFNVQKAPLDNPLVRKALILAVDRDRICVNIGKMGQVPAGAYVPSALSDADPTKKFREIGGDYYDPMPTAQESNVEAAKAALAEAGYPNGEGLPAIEYAYNVGTGHQQIGEALQDMWSKIGVKVDLSSQEWSTFQNSRKNGDFFIARNGWLGDYNDPISFLDMWITGGGNNDAQWSDPAYDQLIKEVKSTGDQAVRFQKMHEAEDIIFDAWMLCPIYYYVDLFMQNTSLDGIWASPLGFKYFMYAKAAA